MSVTCIEIGSHTPLLGFYCCNWLFDIVTFYTLSSIAFHFPRISFLQYGRIRPIGTIYDMHVLISKRSKRGFYESVRWRGLFQRLKWKRHPPQAALLPQMVLRTSGDLLPKVSWRILSIFPAYFSISFTQKSTIDYKWQKHICRMLSFLSSGCLHHGTVEIWYVRCMEVDQRYYLYLSKYRQWKQWANTLCCQINLT